MRRPVAKPAPSGPRVLALSGAVAAAGAYILRTHVFTLGDHLTALNFLESVLQWVGINALGLVLFLLGCKGALNVIFDDQRPAEPAKPAERREDPPAPREPQGPTMPLAARMASTPMHSPGTPGAGGLSIALRGGARRAGEGALAGHYVSPSRAGSAPPQTPGSDAGGAAGTPESRRGTPKYCPSPPPRAEARKAEVQGTHLSSYEQYLELLGQWGISESSVELWTEGLREWFGATVLRPLIERASGAHAEALAIAAELGWKGTLRPLSEAGADFSSWFHAGPGPGATPEDDLAVCLQLRAQVEEQLGRLQPRGNSLFGFSSSSQSAQDAALQSRGQELLRALENYACLAKVLRGDFVPALLGPSPPGYVLARAGHLVEGRAPLAGFLWDSGVSLPSRPWRAAGAPTDSALLLYLFACFLEAPGWDFASRADHRRPATYGPLFLGQMPHGAIPTTRHFSAILEGSQVPRGGVAHAVVYDRAVSPPQFQLVVGGKVALVLGGRTGLFHALLLWLWHARDSFRGMVGDLSLSASLRLDDVFSARQEPSLLKLNRLLGL